MGLHRAWPNAVITGVDLTPQPRYPFRFVQADALTYPLEGFDFIWASPPCQRFSLASLVHKNNGKEYPDLLTPIRNRLQGLTVPWIIENVPAAPLNTHVVRLCGLMFGLKVFRHRCFQTSFVCFGLPHPSHNGKRIGEGIFSVAGGSGRWKTWGKIQRNVMKGTIAEWQDAMGIDWMTRKEITQAVPPAYSAFLASQLNDLK